MSQTILEKSQGEFNKIRNDEVAKGINYARDLDETYVRQLMEEKQKWSKVTIQSEPIDPFILAGEIKGAIENADRPEAGQAPKMEIGKDYTFSDMQRYVNNKDRQIEQGQIEPKQSEREI